MYLPHLKMKIHFKLYFFSLIFGFAAKLYTYEHYFNIFRFNYFFRALKKGHITL